MEDIAMLVFYLPIIIFEAMLESQESKRKRARGKSEVGSRAQVIE
jgi:hypothetical protein